MTPPPKAGRFNTRRRADSRAWGPIRLLAVSGGTRIILLPLVVGIGLVATRITVSQVGVPIYGAIALISTLAALLPFADLGVGAAVTTAAAHLPKAGDKGTDFHAVVLGSLRLLLASAVAIFITDIAVSLSVGWAVVLGIAPHDGSANFAVTVVLALFALSLPFGLGARVLNGIGKNHVALATLSAASLFTLTGVALLSVTHSDPYLYAIVPAISALLAAFFTTLVAARLADLSPTLILRHSARRSAHPGGKVMHVAVPMMVIMLALPVALQTDRIVLAHRSTPSALTDYALASQLYLPLWSIISTAGVTLWPYFARQQRRGNKEIRNSWLRTTAAVSTAGLCLGVALVVLGPWLTIFTSAGKDRVTISLFASFSCLLVIQSIHLTSGMLLTQPRQLWFQAICCLAVVVINLPLSWWLARPLAAAGPVVASAATLAALELIPCLLLARHYIKKSSNSLREPIPMPPVRPDYA
jgi:O-antigen/teichoic acid export membrane protein